MKCQWDEQHEMKHPQAYNPYNPFIYWERRFLYIHDMAMQRIGIFQWDRLLYVYIYIHIYLFFIYTRHRKFRHLKTRHRKLGLSPSPASLFSISCLKRFPDTPKIHTMVLQGFLFQLFHSHPCSVIYTDGFCAQQSLPAPRKKKQHYGLPALSGLFCC